MLVRSACSSKDSRSFFSSLVSHLDQRPNRTIFLCYFLYVSVFWKSARFSHSTTGVFLSKCLLLHALFLFFNIINSVCLFWSTDSSRKESMKQTFHQHSLYWLEPGADLGLQFVFCLFVLVLKHLYVISYFPL